MPKPDLAFAVRSIEVSSIALGRQIAKPPQEARARAKMQEALINHQHTLGRLMRRKPLQELGLVLTLGGEIGRLQQEGDAAGFTLGSQEWKQASARWQTLHQQACAQLERQAQAALARLEQKKTVDTQALSKAFALALLVGAVALFLDEQTPSLSALMADDRYKTALSELTMEQMV